MEDREKGERESTIGISHREMQAQGSTSDTPQPGPTPLCSGLLGRCVPRYQVLGGSATQWHTEAEARSVGTRGSSGAWYHSHTGQGSKDKR